MILFILGLLKIIGIILLCLLVLLLLISAIVLWVPIRYTAKGEWNDANKQFSVAVTWMGKLIRFKLDYQFPNKPLTSLKILWMDILKILDGKKKTTAEKVPKKKKERGNKGVREKIKHIKEKKKKKEKYHPAINSALLEAAEAEEAAKNNEIIGQAESVSIEEESIVSENGNIKEMSQDDGEKIQENKATFEEKNKGIIFKIQSIYDKIVGIINSISYYLDVLDEKETRGLIAEGWKTIRKILHSIKPKEYKVDAVFGFETPDTTGRVFGYYCMLSPWIPEGISIEPEFEEKVLNGEVYLKGKITIFVIVRNAIHIMFDKRLKPLINKLKNGGKKNG